MEGRDLEAIVRIDAQITGRPRNEILRRRLDRATSPGKVSTSLVAEHQGQVVGFVLGDVLVGEFGAAEEVATIDTLGVAPAFQGAGVACRLLHAYATNLRALGVERIRTLVGIEDWRLMRFFTRAGFGLAQMAPLQLDLTGAPAQAWLDALEDEEQ